MKIGIFTHPLDYNYGCLLQAYALQKTLKSMGHEVVTLNRFTDPNQPFKKLLKNWCVRFMQRFVKHKNVPLCWNIVETMDIKHTLSANTQRFVDRNIVNTGPIFPKDLQAIDEKYLFDAYVVGSDQVWLPHFSLNAFLDFVHRDNVKKLFYAASSGRQTFADNPEIASKCKELSKSFSGISVREDTLIPIVKNVLGRDAIQVLDPTLLLEAKDYLGACIEKEVTTPIVFTYILDKTEDKQKLIDRVQKDLDLSIVSGSVEKDFKKGTGMIIQNCIYPSVDHWLLNMSRAKFVVTDSFHGTCMSIVFRKPFVVFGNEERGLNRFLSLLRLFGMENRLIVKSSEFNNAFYNSIDTNVLNDRIKELQSISITYLKKNLQ